MPTALGAQPALTIRRATIGSPGWVGSLSAALPPAGTGPRRSLLSLGGAWKLLAGRRSGWAAMTTAGILFRAQKTWFFRSWEERMWGPLCCADLEYTEL